MQCVRCLTSRSSGRKPAARVAPLTSGVRCYEEPAGRRARYCSGARCSERCSAFSWSRHKQWHNIVRSSGLSGATARLKGRFANVLPSASRISLVRSYSPKHFLIPYSGGACFSRVTQAQTSRKFMHIRDMVCFLHCLPTCAVSTSGAQLIMWHVTPNYSFQRTPVHRSRSYKPCGRRR